MALTDFEYDEEKTLWRPGRRAFLFLGASAAVGAMLPASAGVTTTVEAVTEEVAKEFLAARAKLATKDFADLLVETFSRDRVFAPFERSLAFHKAMGYDTGFHWEVK